jgi:Outer membrane protein beta-barrel domain
MKKLVILSSAILIATTATAQLRLGVQAGASISQPNIKVNGISVTAGYSGHSFVYPGIIFDYTIANFLSIQPSVNYLQSGFTNTTTTNILGTAYTTTGKLRINNLAVPINLCVPIKMGNGKLELCAGPTLVVALNGTNSTSTNGGTPAVADVKIGNDSLSLRQINWGTNFGIGYRLKNGLAANVGIQIPVSDLDRSSITSQKINVITGTLSWFLFGNK